MFFQNVLNAIFTTIKGFQTDIIDLMEKGMLGDSVESYPDNTTLLSSVLVTN